MFKRLREECRLEYAESMEENWQMNVLIGVGWKKENRKIREIVLEEIRKAYDIRKRYTRIV